MNSNYGKLYLLPTPLSEGDPARLLTAAELEVISSLKRFVVEELRTARRFLSAAGLRGHIDELELYELNEHTSAVEVEKLEGIFRDGCDAGLLSEAGLPAVADPGAQLVALCHRKGIKVVPMAGPSSLMMALMASGLNGQSFTFRGYLPAKTAERRHALQELERTSSRLNQSQIFIETPYRNDSMLADIIDCCNPETLLCIATDVTAPDEEIHTKTIAEWKKRQITIGKRPSVFILYSWKG
ncbi:MAG: SAM-dependent methyltransferase [Bacteroidales bacterium]|nr:SAM-dependent methyltransferase [Bacteroidales bacterium]